MSAHKKSHKSKHKSKQNLSIKPVYLVVVAGLVIVILLIASLFLFRGGDSQANTQPAEVTIEQAYAMRQAGAWVLDVRTQEEWNDFHIPDSTLIPLTELENRLGEVPRDEEILVVCRTGNRSSTGRDILLNAGYSQVTSMSGGVTQWKAAGYPTITGP